MDASRTPRDMVSPDGAVHPPFVQLPKFSHSSSMTVALNTKTQSASLRSYSPGPSPGSTPFPPSLQSTPDSLAPRVLPASTLPAPMALPEASWIPQASPPPSFISSPPQTSMSEALALGRSPGLMRRLSHGARRLRRRQSNTQPNPRDHNAGPVIMRRRSDSRGVADAPSTVEISDLDLDNDADDYVDDGWSVRSQEMTSDALGIFHRGLPISEDGEPSDAPTLSSQLRQAMPALSHGTPLQKVTKRKRKNLIFRLDFEASKVIWDPTNSSKQLYIDDIREIRVAREASNYREAMGTPADQEPLWFTIVYSDPVRSKGRALKTMHLIAPNEATFALWTGALERVSRNRIELMASLAGTGDKGTRLVWRQAMLRQAAAGIEFTTEADEKIDRATVERLCKALNIHCSANTIRAQFDRADPDGTGFLTFPQFEDFVRRLKEREDVKRIFKEIKSPNESELDATSFLNFLRDTQGIPVDANQRHWENVFEQFARLGRHRFSPNTSPARPTMNVCGFQAYLTSEENPAFVKASHTVLDKPLNEYFISSSHNTYLLGRQVAGESSTEAYISALTKGCRCIEVDCWDGADGRPVVVHGRTFTRKVLFADCIDTINKYAFQATPYPLIISLEVHCNPEQQARMTQIMREKFGDKLLLEPLASRTSTLPSPEEAKGKILIKVKAPVQSDDSAFWNSYDQQIRRERSVSSPLSRPANSTASPAPSPIITSPASTSPSERQSSFGGPDLRGSTTSVSAGADSASHTSSEDSSIQRARDKRPPKRKTSNITPVLGDFGVYTQGIKYTDFRAAEAKIFNHVYSFKEDTFESLCNKHSETKSLLEQHNMQYLMRVYPSGRRIASDNFDPMRFWRRGVQMAATNWQTYDAGQQINDAMFAAGTDRSGYVLKPEEMRTSRPLGSYLDAPSKVGKKLVRFSVDILSAQHVPNIIGTNSGLNPYVKFEMFSADDKTRGAAIGEGGQNEWDPNGVSGIGTPIMTWTPIIANNGYDPTWTSGNHLTLSLETRYPSLVFVRLTVLHSPDPRATIDRYRANNDRTLATFTAKLSSLQQGYRHLPLYDPQNGDPFILATLFVKLKKEDPVPITKKAPTSLSSSTAQAPSSAAVATMSSLTGVAPKKGSDNNSMLVSGPTSAPQPSSSNSNNPIKRLLSVRSTKKRDNGTPPSPLAGSSNNESGEK